MSKRIRVTAKWRQQVDIDKLVIALLEIVEAQRHRQQASERAREDKTPTRGQESAA